MKTRSGILLLVSLALVVAAAGGARAARGNTSSANFLEVGVSSRAAGMGDAYTAWADDVYGFYFNPAGIARNRRQEVGFFYNNSIADITYNYIGYLHPLKSRGTLAASFYYVNLGSVDRTTVSSGQLNQYTGKAKAHDYALTLSYARPISSYLDLGAAAKVIDEKLDNYSATAFAVDLGATFRPPVRGLTFGLSLANLGTSLKFVRENEKLPLTVRAGAGYRHPGSRWGVTSDLSYVRGDELVGKVGGEFWVLPEHFALRAGFNSTSEAANGLTIGTGIRWHDLSFDYAYVPFGDLGNQQTVSLSYQFGAARPDEAEPVATRPAPARPAPTPVTPPLAPAPAVPPFTGPTGAYTSAFTYQTGGPQYDWMGQATAEVLKQAWRKDGFLNGNPDEALYLVTGEYWVVDEQLIITARLVRASDHKTMKTLFLQGDVNQPFGVWNELKWRINGELTALGCPVQVPPAPPRPASKPRSTVSQAPAPVAQPVSPAPAAPAAVPAPQPVAPPVRQASPIPSRVTTGQSIALVSFRVYPGMNESELSRTLLENTVISFQNAGWIVSERAAHRVDATISELSGGDLLIYARIVDQSTGIPLASIELSGTTARLDAVAESLQKEIAARVARL